MNIGNIAPIPVKIEKIIIGRGGLNSASKGANIVEILAPALQIPKAVPAKIAGKRNALAKKHESNVAWTPPFAKATKTGTKFC